MLLILAAILQSLLIFECVLRRFLLLFFHVERTGLQKYADTSMFTTGLAAIAQACTLPLQALASVVSAVNRYLLLAIFIFVVFTMLLILGDNAIFVYSFICRIYNSYVSPHLVKHSFDLYIHTSRLGKFYALPNPQNVCRLSVLHRYPMITSTLISVT